MHDLIINLIASGTFLFDASLLNNWNIMIKDRQKGNGLGGNFIILATALPN